jgi:hypothetical protein
MARKHKRTGHSKQVCRGAKGRVKKGWRFGKGGRCIRAKGK